MTTTVRRADIVLFHRQAGFITDATLLHPAEKDALVEAAPRLRRKRLRAELEVEWAATERAAAAGAGEVLATFRASIEELGGALDELAEIERGELLGKVDAERIRVRGALHHLDGARAGLDALDFGAAGAGVDNALRDLAAFGGPLVLTLNELLAQAAVGRDMRDVLQENFVARRAARQNAEAQRGAGAAALLVALADVNRLEAESFRLAAQILGAQIAPESRSTRSMRTRKDNGLRVMQPHECETFADVGGLEDVKARLRATVGAILERPDEAARYRVVHNGILFHGPPGTGKTLLSRALAGEYGMRFIRFSPATIASSYVHEAARNLQQLFELATKNVPCVLFLDEIDTIASDRGDQPSADHREVVTQLMNSLEEYRNVHGLLIIAATNDIDRLDGGLREGRFDSKIMIPLPDFDARKDVLRVVLEHREDAVEWDDIDLDDIARRTSGRNAASLETFVSMAAQKALAEGRSIRQVDLLGAIKEREGVDRTKLDERLSWDDVILSATVREQLDELMTVFTQPDLARRLGVSAPAGILMHGPPGTGKTTVAKVIASEIQASFYEMSAADILSKWSGESEQRVAKLFTKARANRPSVIFIDEIEGLLRRRTGDTSAPWEQRVVGQFLRELDGLRGGTGVLLVGATNRVDIIDEAIVGRRLVPIEVGLPDQRARERLLKLLFRDVEVAKDLDVKRVAAATDGMSGADLKRLRDVAGMKALTRAARGRGKSAVATVKMADVEAALSGQRDRASLVHV